MNWQAYALIAMILQGTILFTVKLFSFDTPALIILLYQYVGSIISILIYLVIKKISFKLKPKKLLLCFLSGILVSTGLSFYYDAISTGPASKVIPLQNVGITILPAILGFAALKEKITPKTIIGIILSITSILLLTL